MERSSGPYGAEAGLQEAFALKQSGRLGANCLTASIVVAYPGMTPN